MGHPSNSMHFMFYSLHKYVLQLNDLVALEAKIYKQNVCTG